MPWTEVTDGDQRRATDLGRAWRNLRDQLRHHHEQEDTILFPVVVHLGIDPALVEVLEAEHQAMARALGEIDSAMGSYATSASSADAADAADAVRRGTRWSTSTWRTRRGARAAGPRAPRDAEWQTAMRQLRKQPARRAGWFFAWVEDGASDEARAYLASEVPAPVRFILVPGVRPRLPADRGPGLGYSGTVQPGPPSRIGRSRRVAPAM